MIRNLFATILVSMSYISAAHAATEVLNRDALRARYGLKAYGSASLSGLKIAVLDNGFAGYVKGSGQLPESAEVIEGPVNVQSGTSHGLGMAQVVWAMTGARAEGPQFYLVNTNGFSNFKAAVDFVIERKIDIVLYAQVWPFGSNFDGTGFINAAVTRAAKAGILWVNAAGNYGGLVYSGLVANGFGNGRDYLRFENALDENEVTITLSWSDFDEAENFNTSKDLNLFVYDAQEKLVGSGELIQRGEAPREENSKLSSHARETVTLRGLARGSYRIRVAKASDNFALGDLMKVAIRSEKPGAVDFTDRTKGAEIFPPADNANVITVGELDPSSAVGPTADGRAKPDVLLEDAVVAFSNGTQTRGSSNAAAIFAGIAATIKGHRADLGFAWFSAYARQTRMRSNIRDLSAVDMRAVNPAVISNIPKGGFVMQETRSGRHVVVCPQDPISLPLFRKAGAMRKSPDDVLVADFDANRWYAYPVAQAWKIQAPLVEFRQLVQGGWITPLPAEL